jgi:FAD binding domain-containing protein
VFYVADTTMTGPMTPAELNIYLRRNGFHLFFPMRGQDRWRVVGVLPRHLSNRDNLEFAAVAPSISEEVGASLLFRECRWFSTYHIHHRRAERFRDRRCFLLGDAAHIHSPVGGQGMNTGMQDAHNLAWKLAHVTKRIAPPEILDSYNLERHRLGKQLLRTTELATRAGMLRKPMARAIRDHAARYLSQLDIVQHRIARTVAELSLSYAGSPIVDESRELMPRLFGGDESDESATLSAQRKFAAGPRAGERAPDAEILDKGMPRRLSSLLGNGCHALLLFDGRARTEAGYRTLSHIASALEARHPEVVKVFTIVSGREPPGWTGPLGRILLDPDGSAEDAYGATAECVYVIRPDLYIGHRCQPASLDHVLQHFAKVLI